jgi:hypothetical protein
MLDRTLRLLLTAVCVVTLLGWLFLPAGVQTRAPITLPQLHGSTEGSMGSAVVIGDLTDKCTVLLNNGALAIALSINFADVESDQGIFQTADDEQGLFLEFQRSERHLLRLGVRTNGEFQRIPLAVQTWRGTRDILLVIRGNGLVSIAGLDVNQEVQLATPEVECRHWVVGSGNGLSPQVGQVNLSWQFARLPDTFDEVLSDYRKEIDSADTARPSSMFWVMLVAAGIMALVAIRAARDRDRSLIEKVH